jgi:hypothetical protein
MGRVELITLDGELVQACDHCHEQFIVEDAE